MAKNRNNRSELTRLKRFQESVRYGPIFTCSSCHQDLFRDSVIELRKVEEKIKAANLKLFDTVFFKKFVIKIEIKEIKENKEKIRTSEEEYVCNTCKLALLKGKLPSMSAANGLKLEEMGNIKLSEIENNIIAQRILFQKIFQLPKSRMSACKDKLINIPISPEDVVNSVESFPRTPSEAGLLEVK